VRHNSVRGLVECSGAPTVGRDLRRTVRWDFVKLLFAGDSSVWLEGVFVSYWLIVYLRNLIMSHSVPTSM
jgi:hypothetical protein